MTKWAGRVALRAETADDRAFLAALYATTRDYEMALVDWPQLQKRQFLQMQFEAQYRYYREHFPVSAFAVITLDARPVGRRYLEERDDEFRLIDIALLPELRGQGLGSWLMREVLEQAGAVAKPVRIHVERMNPALRLYQRLGFRTLEDKGVHLFMEWRPPAALR